jgi:hypothetical protein
MHSHDILDIVHDVLLYVCVDGTVGVRSAVSWANFTLINITEAIRLS